MKREVKIGIFAIVIICCSWAGIRFLSGIDIFGRNIDYYASYDKITGINYASPVMIQGVKVGTVTDIILDPTESNKVTLKLSIKRKFQIPENSTAKIFSPGLMSSMAIGLTLGDSATMLDKGDTITSDYDTNIMDMAAEKMDELTDKLSTISDNLNTTLVSVNELLEGSSSNIESTIANLNSISTDISKMLTAQNDNIESAVESLSKFSATLGNNTENMDSIISNLTALSEDLAEAEIASSLDTTITELNTTLAKINSAEGSAGKLINDEQLYNNLSAVSGSLNELIIDMQKNPKRYVHFSLFGSKDKE